MVYDWARRWKTGTVGILAFDPNGELLTKSTTRVFWLSQQGANLFVKLLGIFNLYHSYFCSKKNELISFDFSSPHLPNTVTDTYAFLQRNFWRNLLAQADLSIHHQYSISNIQIFPNLFSTFFRFRHGRLGWFQCSLNPFATISQESTFLVLCLLSLLGHTPVLESQVFDTDCSDAVNISGQRLDCCSWDWRIWWSRHLLLLSC